MRQSRDVSEHNRCSGEKVRQCGRFVFVGFVGHKFNGLGRGIGPLPMVKLTIPPQFGCKVVRKLVRFVGFTEPVRFVHNVEHYLLKVAFFSEALKREADIVEVLSGVTVDSDEDWYVCVHRSMYCWLLLTLMKISQPLVQSRNIFSIAHECLQLPQ
jgi:hypothetical protein